MVSDEDQTNEYESLLDWDHEGGGNRAQGAGATGQQSRSLGGVCSDRHVMPYPACAMPTGGLDIQIETGTRLGTHREH